MEKPMTEDDYYMEKARKYEEEQQSISCEEYATESEVMAYEAA